MGSKTGLQFGQLDRYTLLTFFLLVLQNVLQVHCSPLPGSGTEPENLCLRDCSNEQIWEVCGSDGRTYDNLCEFVNARCWDDFLVIAYYEPCPCVKDCSDQPISEVCGSDAETYSNMCEFENARCYDDNLAVVYHESCVTLPPPPENLCKQQQNKFLDLTKQEYEQKCDNSVLKEKRKNSTLELMDFNQECYEPKCKREKYYPIQCSSQLPGGWCWCSDVDGIRIEGTLKKGLQIQECMGRNSCMAGDIEYYDGDLFVPDSGCGLCECLNGEVTCFEDYVPTIGGLLTASQLEDLKSELIQLFFFQFNHKEHVLIDIRHTHQHPTIISSSKKMTVLEWKFSYYDRNGNEGLSPGEQWLFQREIDSFIHCSTFFDHVTDLIDANSDDELLIYEWGDFFDVDMHLDSIPSGGFKRKRSVAAPQEELATNRLKNRKKFYYTLA